MQTTNSDTDTMETGARLQRLRDQAFTGDSAALAEFARLTLQDAGITVLAEL